MLKCVNSTIGIIDSGIGGVSVLNRLIERNKGGNYIYFADNLFMPYGNKNKSFLVKRLDYLINMLFNDYHVNLIIVACNTASSLIDISKYKNVIAMTFDNNKTYFATELTKKNLSDINVIADKTLASQIEKYITNKVKLNRLIKNRIARHKLDELDSFMLGCTHYELVYDIFAKYCVNSKVESNIQQLIDKIPIINNSYSTNVMFLESKASQSYIDKLYDLIRK